MLHEMNGLRSRANKWRGRGGIRLRPIAPTARSEACEVWNRWDLLFGPAQTSVPLGCAIQSMDVAKLAAEDSGVNFRDQKARLCFVEDLGAFVAQRCRHLSRRRRSVAFNTAG